MRKITITPSITDRISPAVSIYLKEITKYPRLNFEQEKELSKRILEQHDQKAIHELVQSNLLFVVSVAKQYPTKDLEQLDLISEGNVGLLKAAERFDASKGFRFISYAVWWIRQSIMNALTNTGRIVRIPASKIYLQHKIFEYIAQFEQTEERTPTPVEIAEAMKESTDTVMLVLGVSDKHKSLDLPLGDDSDGTLLDVLEDTNTPSTDQLAEENTLVNELQEALRSLDPREKLIIVKSFGLEGKEESLEEIACEINLSKERVRQLKEVALRKLKNSASLSQLLSA